MIDKICEYCGKTYQVYKSAYTKSRFCSMSCRSKNTMGKGVSALFWNGGDITFDCIVCGTKTTRRRGQSGGKYKFCSWNCHNIYRQKRVPAKCINCGVDFELRQSHFDRGSKFCSQKCNKEYLTRENSPHWKGGERGRKFYPKQWNNTFKNAIRERDNYTCAVCKKYGDNVHHINYVKNDTVPENCITLCRSCHAKTNSNREYWVEYFKLKLLE